VKRRWKAIGASAIILLAAVLAGVVLFATLQPALTTESAQNEQNPLYVQPQPNVQVRLGESATAGNLTFRVQNVMNGTDPEALEVWASVNATNHYAPLNPIPGSTYAIINATVTNALNGTSPFSYSHVILVGNDGRSYYANYAEGNASCSASLAAAQFKPGGACSVYIAFSIPDDVAPAKIVYTASNPAVVVNLV
jgi:hypothetical protein